MKARLSRRRPGLELRHGTENSGADAPSDVLFLLLALKGAGVICEKEIAKNEQQRPSSSMSSPTTPSP